MSLSELLPALRKFKAERPTSNKAEVERFFTSYTQTRKDRSVFVASDYCIRFSEANTGSFSNVVLSLSALRKHDTVPVVICIVRPDRLDEGIPNRPERFDELIAIHAEFSWDDNVNRLVEATSSIIARSTRFQPTPSELAILRNAPRRAAAAITARLQGIRK
jgi:hypothetical protein